MSRLILFLLLWQSSAPVKHSLKYFFTASSGPPGFQFVAYALVDDVMAGYCDTNRRRAEAAQGWMKDMFASDPQHWDRYTRECFDFLPNYFRSTMDNVQRRLNQTGDVHTLQRMYGCEWDDETDEKNGFNQYAYDGEDFIAFDLKTMTWITSKPQALMTKLRWDADQPALRYYENYLTEILPQWLRKYLDFGKDFLLRTELPSLYLLQKTPSSPIRCFATGFYPKRAVVFWRRDREELHEGVDHGEIRPNHDGTFQMSVDLKPPGPSEDWGRYDCVFQLSGVDEELVKNLERDDILTNRVKPFDISIPIAAAVVLLVLLLSAIVVIIVYRQKKQQKEKIKSSVDSSQEIISTTTPDENLEQREKMLPS